MKIPEIQPFEFIRGTAFSERVQLANKVNEIIDGINSIGDIPDIQAQVDALSSTVSTIQTGLASTNADLDALTEQVNSLISEVNTMIKQAISALESDVEGIDTRLTTAEGTISEHGREIDGLLKEVIDGVAMMSDPHGTIQVQINHEDGTKDISPAIDLGLVAEGGITLQSGTTDRSFKLIVTLTDGTSWQTNDFVIPEGGGTDVSVTNISIAQGSGTDKIQVKIGLSDGSTISSNDWTVVTPAEFSALGTRVTTAEGNITKNTGDISGLDTRVQALEDSPGFTLQPATTTTLGGVKIGANVTVQADGAISVDLSPYALKTEIPDVSQFVTAEDVAANYQPKGNYLTKVPIGGTAIGGVKNGGNVTIETDGTMNVNLENEGYTVYTGSISALASNYISNYDILLEVRYSGSVPAYRAKLNTSSPFITIDTIDNHGVIINGTVQCGFKGKQLSVSTNIPFIFPNGTKGTLRFDSDNIQIGGDSISLGSRSGSIYFINNEVLHNLIRNTSTGALENNQFRVWIK